MRIFEDLTDDDWLELATCVDFVRVIMLGDGSIKVGDADWNKYARLNALCRGHAHIVVTGDTLKGDERA